MPSNASSWSWSSPPAGALIHPYDTNRQDESPNYTRCVAFRGHPIKNGPEHSLPGFFGMGQARPISAHNGPRAVGLLTSTSASSFRTPVYEDLLRIVRAPKPIWVLVVIPNLELAVMAAFRIPPLISGVRPSGIEAIGIRLVCVAPIIAIEMAGQSRAERSS